MELSEEQFLKILKDPPVSNRTSWNKGKRKPTQDEEGVYWCNCTLPDLTTHIGSGSAYCRKCKTSYYH